MSYFSSRQNQYFSSPARSLQVRHLCLCICVPTALINVFSIFVALRTLCTFAQCLSLSYAWPICDRERNLNSICLLHDALYYTCGSCRSCSHIGTHRRRTWPYGTACYRTDQELFHFFLGLSEY